jgi:hypothetical protein
MHRMEPSPKTQGHHARHDRRVFKILLDTLADAPMPTSRPVRELAVGHGVTLHAMK